MIDTRYRLVCSRSGRKCPRRLSERSTTATLTSVLNTIRHLAWLDLHSRPGLDAFCGYINLFQAHNFIRSFSLGTARKSH
ncbi:MAG: hypothetical protein M2R45_03848 [Verrucomicrobia subdivision 3 bacterium]|nr:hypothetical protein [Limisphaerales bacterium]MCS1415804.1 hypothetical protein [Limisphaerales bacterium]